MTPQHDEAHAITDVYLSDIEKRLKSEYSRAAKEVQAKLDDYLRRFRTKDEIWRKRLAAGEVTAQEYRQWRTGQIMIGKHWEDVRDTLAQDLRNADKIARSIINSYMPEVYALNHNYATFTVERDSLVDTDYALYTPDTVKYIMRENPELLPPPGNRVKKEIAEGRALRWERQQLQSVMLQGILQGKSIPELARDTAKTLRTRSLGDAVRYARTAATGAENAGRYDAFRRAEKLGVNLTLEWAATLDRRTRTSHRHMHGQRTTVDRPFVVDGQEILYPGYPKAPQEQLWNCRCTILSWVKGHEHETHRTSEKMGGLSFEEWLKAKPVYNSIKLPLEKQEAIKGAYIAEYRKARERLG